MLYVTTELDKTVSIIDPKTLKIVGSVPTGQEQSHMLVLSRDGSRGYTANVGPGNGVGAGHEGAQDAGDHSDLEEARSVSRSRATTAWYSPRTRKSRSSQ